MIDSLIPNENNYESIFYFIAEILNMNDEDLTENIMSWFI